MTIDSSKKQLSQSESVASVLQKTHDKAMSEINKLIEDILREKVNGIHELLGKTINDFSKKISEKTKKIDDQNNQYKKLLDKNASLNGSIETSLSSFKENQNEHLESKLIRMQELIESLNKLDEIINSITKNNENLSAKITQDFSNFGEEQTKLLDLKLSNLQQKLTEANRTTEITSLVSDNTGYLKQIKENISEDRKFANKQLKKVAEHSTKVTESIKLVGKSLNELNNSTLKDEGNRIISEVKKINDKSHHGQENYLENINTHLEKLQSEFKKLHTKTSIEDHFQSIYNKQKLLTILVTLSIIFSIFAVVWMKYL